jgi:hypothetical protein
MDADDSEALAILRRLEPTLNQLQRDVVDIRVQLARKPERAELWLMTSAMVTLFAFALAGLAYLGIK